MSSMVDFRKRYNISDKKICNGGQAIIKQAYDSKLRRAVAIKIFKKKHMSAKAIRSAKLEKKIMEGLNHPTVMKISDACEDEHHLCLVMDLKVDDMRNVLNDMYGALEERFARKVFQMMV